MWNLFFQADSARSNAQLYNPPAGGDILPKKHLHSCMKAAGHAYGWYQALIQKVGHLLFGRYSLIFTSLIILLISVNVLLHLYGWALSPENNLEEMLREAEGVSTLFLGIGLILKERRLLEKIFYTGPGHDDWINRLCLHTGLCLILNGTAMRIAAQLNRFPDRIISMEGKEQVLFTVGLFFSVLATLLLVYLVVMLILGDHCEKALIAESGAHGRQPRKQAEL